MEGIEGSDRLLHRVHRTGLIVVIVLAGNWVALLSLYSLLSEAAPVGCGIFNSGLATMESRSLRIKWPKHIDPYDSDWSPLRRCAGNLNYSTLSFSGLEAYNSSDGLVLDIQHGRYLRTTFLSTFDSELRWVSAVLSACLEAPETSLWYLDILSELETDILRANPPEEPSEPPRPAYAVVVSAVVLLSLVYQYLTGNVDKGGSKAYSRSSLDFRDIYVAILLSLGTLVVVSAVVLLSLVYQYLTGNVDKGGSKAYSRSSLDFRDIYVAIVLFLGAYVWIKFREVAFKGVYSRELKDQGGRITKVVHEPRFKPPRENGRKFEWIYLGQYATPEEASILYRIAAFYYNENQGSLLDLEDGRWFPIPPMDEVERSLTGLEKRAWVKVQVMKVYEEFKKEKAWLEFLEAWDGEVQAQGQDEGVAVSNGHSLGSPEGPAIPISQLTPDTQSGMGISSSNQLGLLQTLVRTQQELITYQQQQISLQEQQLQECRAQILELKQQHYLQQLLQDINEGVPSNEVEMGQSMHLQNH